MKILKTLSLAASFAGICLAASCSAPETAPPAVPDVTKDVQPIK